MVFITFVFNYFVCNCKACCFAISSPQQHKKKQQWGFLVSSYWGAIFINTRSMVKWLRRLKDTPQKKWRPSDINYIETSRLQKYQEAFKISQWVTGEVSPRRDRTLNLQVFFNIDYYWLQGKTDMLLYTRQGQLPLFANMPLWSDTKSEWMWEEIWIYMYRKESEFDYQNRTSILEIFTKFKAKKIWIFSQVFWISLNFRKKNLNDSDKIWMNGRSESVHISRCNFKPWK